MASVIREIFKTRNGRLMLVLVGIAIYEILHSLHYINEELNLGIIVAALIITIHLLYEILTKLEHEDLLARKVQLFSARHNDTSGKLLENIYREITNAIGVSEDSFQIRHDFLAVASYVQFWRLLCVEQAMRGQGRPLTAYALHAGPIPPLVRSQNAKPLIRIQRKFVNLGGKIERILCGYGSHPSKEIEKLADTMRSHAAVYYYDINSGAVQHNFSWDFCTVSNIRSTAIWSGFNQAESLIERATYNQKGTHVDGTVELDLIELWNRFLENADPIQPSRPENNRVHPREDR